MKRKGLPFALVLLAVASTASLSHAAVINVPANHAQIQLAIDVATSSDEIVINDVAQGANPNYKPFLLDKSISISVDPAFTGQIVVDASDTTAYAAAISAVGASISGLTLRGGTVCVVDVRPGTVSNCLIQDDGHLFSSAAALVSSGGVLENCTLDLTAGAGKAVRLIEDSPGGPGFVIGNRIDMTIEQVANGFEGIYVEDNVGAEIRNNEIVFRGSMANYGGGIIIPTVKGRNSKIFSNVIRNGNIGVYVDTGSLEPTAAAALPWGLLITSHGNLPLSSATTVGDVQISSNTVVNCDFGIGLRLGKGHSLTNNTIVRDAFANNTTGIWVAGLDESAVSEFKWNLIVNLGTGFLWNGTDTDATQWDIYRNGYWSSGNIGIPSEDPLSTTELRSDLEPLFCEGRDGTEEYSHRIDSQYSPVNTGAFGGDIVGTLGVECAFGTLRRSSTVEAGTAVAVVEDVTVPAGITLTLQEGSSLEFDGLDNSGGGSSTSLNELIVQGTLSAGGTGSEVTFTSSSSSPAAGDWAGIVAGENSSVTIENGRIEYAAYGIQDTPAGPATLIDLDDTDIQDFQTAGVYLFPSSQPANDAGVLDLDDCTIDMTGAPYGLYLEDRPSFGYEAYSVSLDDVAITGDNLGTYGIFLDMTGPSSTGKQAVVTGCSVNGLVNGTGVYIREYSPQLRNVDVSGCKWGVQMLGSGAPKLQPVGTGTSTDPSEISDATTGLYVKDCDPDVDVADIADCQFGLYTDNGAQGSYVDVNITGGDTGFRAKSSSSHLFSSGSITGFSTNGVLTNSGCGVNIVQNNIHSSDPGVVWYVQVKPYLSALGDVLAEDNWWGSDPPPSGLFNTGVDYTPWSSSLFTLGSVTPDVEAVPETPSRFLLQAGPNPFAREITFRMALPQNAKTLTVAVFDAQGRRLRSWTTPDMAAGSYEMTWDGRSEDGRPVAGGVYFVRVHSGTETETARIVRVQR